MKMKLGIAGLLVAAASAAYGNCWRDGAVEDLAARIAERGFPLASGRMPLVLVCDAAHFPPNIGGMYVAGAHRILIPVGGLGNNLQPTLAHELAHAEVALAGGGDTAEHGTRFYAALIRAGFGHEAQRVAGYVGNGHDLAAAQGRGAGAGPERGGERQGFTMRICSTVVIQRRVLLLDGRVCVFNEQQMHCRNVQR